MIKKIQQNTKHKMQKYIEIFKNNINKFRNSSISPNLLNGILVKSHYSSQPIQKIAYIVNINPNTLCITAFDKTSISSIKKSILNSNLGITPIIIGEKIHLQFPIITQENRIKLIKLAQKEAETCKISIRKIRKDMNEKTKKLKKEKTINQDEYHKIKKIIQNITDKNIKKIDHILQKKEKDINTI
ncbi:Ribosome-recycling factor [Candidatus Westeberhardia cardiocondylae]|uniref:Ribosome-recycling factor n=1 Tax=Candidatus Westeberhardia cardiocondylae TaxID=1594731 RepID=A0A0H5C5P6_9ENTR|nr:ribosome recycling factor [Candidatus Westeberhardia cardiocondylae]MCR3756295.1 ribosome-recycling factor [Candidatus Westeberhardia cardiocondylae]CEN32286.1 Ribosome-recycling factor [Candidatus Westeberhardia cardiocondylae]